MNTLGPTERALLVALQEADEPTTDDRDRVRAAVLQRVATASGIAVATWTAASAAGKAGAGLTLAQGSTSLAAASLTAIEGTGAAVGSAAAGSAAAGSTGAAVVGGTAAKVAGAAVFSSAMGKVAAAVVGLGLASGATWYAVDHGGSSKPQNGVVIVEQQSSPMPVQAKALPSRSSLAMSSSSGSIAAEQVDKVDLAEKPIHRANKVALRSEPVQAVDTLADEAELLKRAQQAINSGNTALALALVEEHAERYPNGVLAQERSGVRAISLCLAGALQQGVAQAQSFLQKNPVSPLSERVRSVCKL